MGAASGFNPHPSRRTGATQTELEACRLAVSRFNPHPSRRTGATIHDQYLSPCLLDSFNPHPSRRTGATVKIARLEEQNDVSILTRPEGRVQRSCVPVGPAQSRRFQSSPVPKDGCNSLVRDWLNECVSVSILTRPEGRVQHQLRVERCKTPNVSILTRPEGRVQR